MPKKVLVFESDVAFANDLRGELGKLGCSIQVVDDGNVGLQHASSERPDLILLSIELPRMNGFSVCNKLKKDSALKDVPLIILSSESSEETFEQHRKLRTRADIYVHKPIAFRDLLTHINSLVDLTSNADDVEDVFVIDDDDPLASIDIDADDATANGSVAAAPRRKPRSIDQEVDALTDQAFDRLTGDEPSSRSSAVPPAPPPRVSAPPAPPPSSQSRPSLSIPGPPKRPSSSPPRPVVDTAELDRVRQDSEKFKTRAVELERDLATTKSELSRVQNDLERNARSDSESQKMQREIDDLKAKLANQAKSGGGGVSSREFLDLREALNKKDKEILGLKETASKKEKEIVEATDRTLALERSKGELDDKVLATERELADARDRIEALSADKELAKKVSEDFKTRFERTKADLDVKLKEIQELNTRRADDHTAHEGQMAALKVELEEVRQRDVAQAEREGRGRLTLREEELEEKRLKDLATLTRDRDEKIAAISKDRDDTIAALEGDHTERFETLEKTYAEKVRVLETERDAKVSALEARAAGFEVEAAGLRGELKEVNAALTSETKRADKAYAKWGSDKASLLKAKEAIANARVQIEEIELRPIDSD